LIRDLKKALRFYFITDDSWPDFSPVEQVKVAVKAGATMIQYRNKAFSPRCYEEVIAIRDICKSNNVLFVVNDDIVLAKAVMADGVHVGQEDENPAVARSILGTHAIVGVSVSTMEELKKTDISPCDYIGVGPVFQTGTKKDAKKAIGLDGLARVVKASPLPVVAIGGINEKNAHLCFEHGVSGVSLISAISRSNDPVKSANELAGICKCRGRKDLDKPWEDEFKLIDRLLESFNTKKNPSSWIIVPPGDDASLLSSITRPVITTDTQREGVHFSFMWQTPEEIGQKAVEITLSDLAASYALPVCLFINLGLPSYVSDKDAEKIYKGAKKALDNHNCSVGGGNISAADKLSIDLFAIGQAREDLFPKRSQACIGDKVFVTGPLGMARAGLDALIKRDFSFQKLIHKFKFPTAKFDAAKILAENEVFCAMDISDGLAGDAAHIAKASDISIELDFDESRLDPELVKYCKKHGLSAKEMAVSGGEDYELLFTCRPQVFKRIKTLLPEAFQVGRCVAFQKSRIIGAPGKLKSFQHGKK
jgi:thiamin-phosphate kinase